MKTILSQIPTYIQKYPVNDQAYLNDFFSLFQQYNVDIIESRETLSTNFDSFIEKHQNSQEYNQIPFLWFACRFITNANLLLSIEGFYADRFYGYLVQHLRGDNNKAGVFQLIQKKTSLKDLVWEELQYASAKLRFPLSINQLQILETVYSMIDSDEVLNILNPRRIKAAILNRVKIPGLSREIPLFFKLLDARWFLQFRSSAFGLDRLFFHFQLNSKIKLKKIINFQDKKNTVLCNSNVYKIRDDPNGYIGTLLVPSDKFYDIQGYLQHCEDKELLTLSGLLRIRKIHRSASLTLYQADNGWGNLNQSIRNQLTLQLKIKHPRKRRIKLRPFFITPPLDSFWHYKNHPHSPQIIKLYCKLPQDPFAFKDLPLKLEFSKSELELLKDLIQQQIITIGFLSYRLWYEFSLNAYWIKAPKMPLEQIERLLQWLPFCEMFFTKENIHLRIRLTSDLYQWIKEDLEWEIAPIMIGPQPLNINYNWYNHKKLEWITPSILKEEK